MVRDRRVGAGGHDGLERRRLGAERQHPGVELAADLAARSGPAAARPRRSARRAPGRRPRRPAQALDLALVLDRAQGLDRPADRRELRLGAAGGGVGEHRAQLRQAVDGDVVGLEAQPAGAGGTAAGRARRPCRGRSAARRRAPGSGLRGVPAVGGEQVGPVGAHQQRAVGAGEAGQVPDVEQAVTRTASRPALGGGGPQPRPAALRWSGSSPVPAQR